MDPSYCFVFDPAVPFEEARRTLELVRLAVEGLYGAAHVRLESRCRAEVNSRSIVVDGSNDVGRALARVYTGLLLREFGAGAFTVQPPDAPALRPSPTSQEAGG